MEIIPRFLPQAFSVSELFLFSAVNAYYFSFAFDSLIYRAQRQYISGCNISNVLSFTPWIFLNFSGLIFTVTGMPIISLAAGMIATVASISPYNEPGLLWTFLCEILKNDVPVLLYMAIVLAAGALLI
jgi:hypothetical protein